MNEMLLHKRVKIVGVAPNCPTGYVGIVTRVIYRYGGEGVAKAKLYDTVSYVIDRTIEVPAWAVVEMKEEPMNKVTKTTNVDELKKLSNNVATAVRVLAQRASAIGFTETLSEQIEIVEGDLEEECEERKKDVTYLSTQINELCAAMDQLRSVLGDVEEARVILDGIKSRNEERAALFEEFRHKVQNSINQERGRIAAQNRKTLKQCPTREEFLYLKKECRRDMEKANATWRKIDSMLPMLQHYYEMQKKEQERRIAEKLARKGSLWSKLCKLFRRT